MTQRCIEAAVRRLLGNDGLRDIFFSEPHRALLDLLEQDTHLTHEEVAVLTALDATFWERVAEQFDPGLQRAA